MSAKRPQQKDLSLVKSLLQHPAGMKLQSFGNQPLSSDSMFTSSQNFNSLTNALGMAFPGAVNVGYPSSNSVPVKDVSHGSGQGGSDGSNGSHGMNINSGSGSGNALPVPGGTVGSRSAEAEAKSFSKNTKSKKEDSANSGSSAVKDTEKDKLIADLLAQLNQAPQSVP